MTLILMTLSYEISLQKVSALSRYDLLLDIRSANHSPRKVVGRALIALFVYMKVAVLGWNAELERSDSSDVSLCASTRDDARDGDIEY